MNKFLYPFCITILLAISNSVRAEDAAYFRLTGTVTPEMLVNEKLNEESRWIFAGVFNYDKDTYYNGKYSYRSTYFTTPDKISRYIVSGTIDEYNSSGSYRAIVGSALEFKYEIDPSTANESSDYNKYFKITTTYNGVDYYLDYTSQKLYYYDDATSSVLNYSCKVLCWKKGTTQYFNFHVLHSDNGTNLYYGSSRIDAYMMLNLDSECYFCLNGYAPDKYYMRSVGIYAHRKYPLLSSLNKIKLGTYNNENNREYLVNDFITGSYNINIVCPNSGTQTLPLYFTKTSKVSATYPTSMTGVTMTNYTPSNYTTETANGKSLVVTPQAAGKSYTISITDASRVPYLSGGYGIVPSTQTLTINFVSQDQVYWTYNGEKLTGNNLELNYTNENTESLPLQLTTELSTLRNADATEPSGLLNRIGRDNDYYWTLANVDKLDFSDKSSYTETIQPATNEEFVNIFGAFPALNLTVKPYKPTLTLTAEQTTLSHDNGDFTIEIPQGSFEAGSGTNMYARVLLIPQFDAFGTEEDAIEALGGAPREGVKDTWLDHSWYKENNLAGYLPEMQWDATNKKYTCRITPENMTFMDWQGNKTTGHRLVSGHYKVQIVPCEGTNSHQYGIVASELADLYITPSAQKMAMYLCVKGADGQPTWKEYVMDNTNLSFEGPKADDHGETAYRHTRLVPNSDYSEVWVESSRHRPADQDEKDFHPNKVSRRAAARATEVVRGSLDGYTKVEPDDYIDLSGVNSANIKLVKNGVASEAQTISVSKSGDNIITGIEDVAADSYDSEAEYYTTSGIRVSAPLQPGIYIERHPSGRSRKITVK